MVLDAFFQVVWPALTGQSQCIPNNIDVYVFGMYTRYLSGDLQAIVVRPDVHRRETCSLAQAAWGSGFIQAVHLLLKAIYLSPVIRGMVSSIHG